MNLPSSEIEKGEPFTYEDYQGLKSHTISKGHENAVWDLHAHPLSNVLFSAGADGIVRTWMVKDGMPLF
jgi:striatin 1/3/4